MKMVSMGGESAFPPGSMVQFKTVHDLQVQGQVVCFDPSLKVLLVRDDTATGKPLMRMFNLSLIKEIKQMSEPTGIEAIESLLSSCMVNVKKAGERLEAAVNTRRREIMPTDVSLVGQRTFLNLCRMFDVRWDGPTIRVIGLVQVTEPFTSDDVSVIQKEINSELDNARAQDALQQVKKVLSKSFTVDRQLPDEISASVKC